MRNEGTGVIREAVLRELERGGPCYFMHKVYAAPDVTNITFRPQPPVDPMQIIHLIQKNKHIKLAGNEKLRIERELPEAKDRAQMVRDVLRSLGQPLAAAATAKA